VRQLLRFAATLIGRGDPLPQEVRGYVVEFLRDPTSKISKGKPGRDEMALDVRNSAIIIAMQRIRRTLGIPPTRNQQPGRTQVKRKPSAASIVREALADGAGLHLTEAAINAIWNKEQVRVRKEEYVLKHMND
jgi:hypothetical protein